MSGRGDMAIAGQDIEAGSRVVLGLDKRAYGSPEHVLAPVSHLLNCIGVATERIREGFRISVKDGMVREDDA